MGALVSRADSSIRCLLCGSFFHKSCLPDWNINFHSDGSWLCDICHKIEIAWSLEDFDYDELDQSDDVEKPYVSGAEKAKAARRCREKKKVLIILFLSNLINF